MSLSLHGIHSRPDDTGIAASENIYIKCRYPKTKKIKHKSQYLGNVSYKFLNIEDEDEQFFHKIIR